MRARAKAPKEVVAEPFYRKHRRKPMPDFFLASLRQLYCFGNASVGQAEKLEEKSVIRFSTSPYAKFSNRRFVCAHLA